MGYTLTNFDGPAIVKRMRQHFRGILPDDAEIGIRTVFPRGISVKAESASKEITSFANTDDVDCDGEVLIPEGADWETLFKANGSPLFADHNYGVTDHMGMARSIALRRTPTGGKGWLLKGVVRTNSDNPLKKAVIEGAEDGYIGMSVGFIPIDRGPPTPEEARHFPKAGRIVRKWAPFEVSYTFLPCNLACNTGAVSLDISKANEIQEHCTKGRIRPSTRGLFAMPELAAPRPVLAPRRRVVVIGA